MLSSRESPLSRGGFVRYDSYREKGGYYYRQREGKKKGKRSRDRALKAGMLSANCQIDHRLSGRSKTKRGGEESGYGSEFDEKLGEHRVNVQPFSTLFLRMRACFFFSPSKISIDGRWSHEQTRSCSTYSGIDRLFTRVINYPLDAVRVNRASDISEWNKGGRGKGRSVIYYASQPCKLSRTMEQYRRRNKGRAEQEWRSVHA